MQRFVHLSTSELYYTGTGEGAIRMKEWYHKPTKAFLRESRPKDMAARGEWSALPFTPKQSSAYTVTKLRAEYLVQRANLDGLATVVLRPAPVLSGLGDADEVSTEDAPPPDECTSVVAYARCWPDVPLVRAARCADLSSAIPSPAPFHRSWEP